MKLPLPILIGMRYVLSPRDFLSSVASLAVAGLALSIAILVVVQAVLTGFEYELRERILGILPHVTISAKNGALPINEIRNDISTIDGIVDGNSVIEEMVLLVAADEERTTQSVSESSESGHQLRSEPVLVQGIDPNQHGNSSVLLDFVSDKNLINFQSGSFGVFVGSVTAKRLGIVKDDLVTLITLNKQVSLVGFIPRQKRVRVLAVLETGSFMDRNRVYMHFDDASRLFRTNGSASSYEIRIENPYQARSIASQVVGVLADPNLFVSYWLSAYQYGYLYQSIVASRTLLLLVFSLLVAVAAFNLIATVGVMVSERRRDVAVIRTLGGDRKLISGAFLTAGLSISLIGLIVGCIVGMFIGWMLEIGFPWFQQVLNMNILASYFVHSLRVEFVFADLATVFVIGLLLCLLAIFVPTIRAASLSPAKVLRYD
ncbi:MAG: ABC transporter permease [Gammaproteobacteria bacterium]|nr:ABC transporter permease [Gammaproteobacteria bacterium]